MQKLYTVEINQALGNQVKILDSRNKRIDHYEWLTCSKKKILYGFLTYIQVKCYFSTAFKSFFQLYSRKGIAVRKKLDCWSTSAALVLKGCDCRILGT